MECNKIYVLSYYRGVCTLVHVVMRLVKANFRTPELLSDYILWSYGLQRKYLIHLETN